MPTFRYATRLFLLLALGAAATCAGRTSCWGEERSPLPSIAAPSTPPATEVAGAGHLPQEPPLGDPMPNLRLAALGANDREGDGGRRAGQPKPVHSWETGEGKSYLIPALEVPAFLTLLNLFDRVVYHDEMKDGEHVYETSLSSLWDNLHEQHWTLDKDEFDVNQFGHPYQGSISFGLARSTGLNFWESLLYANAGAFLWEMGGETVDPSVNDQINTGMAGSLLGEACFRIAGLVLEDGGQKPDLWHEVGAGFISPPTGVNRHLFGDRFKSVFPSRSPATFWRVNLGGNIDTHMNHSGLNLPNHKLDGMAGFSIDYGLPGKNGYRYRRPLDYFHLDVSLRARGSDALEYITVRGLLFGTDYEAGNDYRGIWGIYGSYDYLSPYLYRASSTAVSLGTTGEYWVGPGVALQGSVLGGYGFAAAGTDLEIRDEGRGYHYGGSPQALVALNLLFGNRAMVDLTGRAYYVTDIGADRFLGPEVVVRGEGGVTVRVAGRHGVGVKYTQSRRDTYYKHQPHQAFSEGTVSVFYTFLSDFKFGAVDWRQGAAP